MHWLAGKALMAMCGLGVVLCVVFWGAGKFGDWPVGGLVVLAAWAPLQLWHTGFRPRLVPAWVTDQRLPRNRRIGMVGAYVAAVGLLAALAWLWPTVGGAAGVAGLVGMFVVVAVLERVVRPTILGPLPDEPEPPDVTRPSRR